MIDSSYLDCIVVNRVHNAFRRNENDNHVLYIPKGKSYDDVLIVNEQGEQILELAKKECTVREIIQQLKDDNPEVAYAKVENDVYRFLQSAVGSNILRIKGLENMYNGEVIATEGEYTVYRCKEGDFKTVVNVISNGGTILEMTDPLLSSGMYNGVAIRARMFNFSEEYYLLKRDDQICALAGIVNGKLYVNGHSFLGKYILIEELSEDTETMFLNKCIENYKKYVNKTAKKLRVRMVKDGNEHLGQVINSLKELGFKKTALLKKDFKEKDVEMYDCLLE